MVNQDPCSGSVAGDSRHGTMAVTPKAKPVDSNEELVEAMGGINESISAENLTDVEWKEDDPLFEFNDENVTILQTPAAASTPVQIENNSFIPQITPQKEALLPGVNRSMSFKGSSSIMLEA